MKVHTRWFAKELAITANSFARSVLLIDFGINLDQANPTTKDPMQSLFVNQLCHRELDHFAPGN